MELEGLPDASGGFVGYSSVAGGCRDRTWGGKGKCGYQRIETTNGGVEGEGVGTQEPNLSPSLFRLALQNWDFSIKLPEEQKQPLGKLAPCLKNQV